MLIENGSIKLLNRDERPQDQGLSRDICIVRTSRFEALFMRLRVVWETLFPTGEQNPDPFRPIFYG
jgi:hypothetical protein